MPSGFAGLIGIDLGTTYSCVAALNRDGIPTTVPNREGDLTTPSVVYIEGETVIVGREAKRTECMAPERTAVCIKRDMGNRYYSRIVDGERYRPEVLSAFILKRLKEDVETRMGPVTHAVITVPAYFDDPRRKATQDAGKIAGLNVIDIINEPTAAALGYALAGYQKKHGGASGFEGERQRSMNALVYDLGGGTFDVSLVRISPDAFETLGTDGDVRLGGRDWDQQLVNYAAEQFIDKYGEDPRTDAESLAVLFESAEQAKHALAVRMATRMMVTHAGQRLSLDVSRGIFDSLTEGLLMRTRMTTELVVETSGLSWNDVDKVLLVGGMTRLPQIRDMLHELTGKIPDVSLPADEVVAHGAAIHGGMLLARAGAAGTTSVPLSEYSTIDVSSHSLGIAVRTGDRYANSILIPRNTRLPTSVMRPYYTSRDDQRQVRVRVLQGEAPEAEACLQIGEFILDGLPENLPERSPIEVECRYGADGRISVVGREPASGRIAETSIVRASGISDTELKDAAGWIGDLPVG